MNHLALRGMDNRYLVAVERIIYLIAALLGSLAAVNSML